MDVHICLPEGHQRLLLHSCCAPCAGVIMERLSASGVDYTLLFYNPNIHPREEYRLRKEENKAFAHKLGAPFIDADYNPRAWYARTQHMSNEPERGIRCTVCFDMRFEYTARYASEHGFTLFSSTLGISRWKNLAQINACGVRCAAPYHPHVQYWEYNWRQKGGSQRMLALAKEEQFYQQQYCGCSYSLRDTNRHRERIGREAVVIGRDFYRD